jgi:hypothetical protein
MQAASDNIPFGTFRCAPEAHHSMVDQLDEARARDSFECRERPRNKALIEVDIIFHDDRSGIATVDELRQRQNMTAVTAILACESLSTIVIDELPLIEISALVFGDQSSVDRIDADDVQSELHCLSAQPLPALRAAIKIDGVDENRRSRRLDAQVVGERFGPTDPLKNCTDSRYTYGCIATPYKCHKYLAQYKL